MVSHVTEMTHKMLGTQHKVEHERWQNEIQGMARFRMRSCCGA